MALLPARYGWVAMSGCGAAAGQVPTCPPEQVDAPGVCTAGSASMLQPPHPMAAGFGASRGVRMPSCTSRPLLAPACVWGGDSFIWSQAQCESVWPWRFVTDFDVGENGRGAAGSLGTSCRGTGNCRCARAELKVGLWLIAQEAGERCYLGLPSSVGRDGGLVPAGLLSALHALCAGSRSPDSSGEPWGLLVQALEHPAGVARHWRWCWASSWPSGKAAGDGSRGHHLQQAAGVPGASRAAVPREGAGSSTAHAARLGGLSGCTQERSLARIPLLSPWDWACLLEAPCAVLSSLNPTELCKTNPNNQQVEKLQQN